MTEANEYLDLAELENFAEELPAGEEIETDDYREDGIILPGRYVSTSRVIQGKQKEDGHVTFAFVFAEGIALESDPSTVFLNGNYPLRSWASTKPFTFPDRAGKTSGAAQYLRAVGVDPKGLNMSAIFNAMRESQNVPVGVYIGYEDRGVKQPDGSYKSRNLKTKNFNLGTREEPVWVPSIEIDGETVWARPRVSGFFQLS